MDIARAGRSIEGGGSAGVGQCIACRGEFPQAELQIVSARRYCATCADRQAQWAASLRPRARAEEGGALPDVQPDQPVREPDRPGSADPREAAWSRYAELRRRCASGKPAAELLAEAAEAAEELGLTLEAIELCRETLTTEPENQAAQARLQRLERRARATGETGHDLSSGYRPRGPAPEAKPFWSDLGALLGYPFRGRGAGVVLASSLFFAVVELIASINIFGAVISLCVFGYLACYLFDIVNSTAAGKDEPPEFPEVLSLLESMVFPLFAFLACAVASFSPALVVVWATAKGWLPAPVGIALAALGMAVGFFLLPATLMARSVLGSVGDALNPSLLLGSVGRILPDYVAAFFTACVVWGAWGVVRLVATILVTLVLGSPDASALLTLDVPRLAGWLLLTALSWPPFIVCLMVYGHLLGRLYRQSHRRLAWFGTPGPEAKRAARLSAAVLFGGLGAVVLATLGLVGLWALYNAGGSGAAHSYARCPIREGTELTYFFENTDGPAGLVRYTFERDAAGNLVVKASVRRAGVPAGFSTPELVEVFDPGNGRISEATAFDAAMSRVARAGHHTMFYGPRRSGVGSSYVNDWTVREEVRWQDRWDTYRAQDTTTSIDFLYDRQSGLLVGRRFHGIGYQIDEWLCEVKGLPGFEYLPPPNRSFEDVEPTLGEDRVLGVPTETWGEDW